MGNLVFYVYSTRCDLRAGRRGAASESDAAGVASAVASGMDCETDSDADG